jgi:hypothetical protein
MQIETVPIESVSPDPANARKHSRRNIEAITASLRRFGQQKPIVVDGNNVVRAGNGTLAAAQGLGWKTIQITRTGLAGSEATAFAIADNRTAELAEWDDDILSSLLADPAIGDVGFGALNDDSDNPLSQETSDDELALDGSSSAKFEVVVECESESEQQKVFESLKSQGHTCRLLTL